MIDEDEWKQKLRKQWKITVDKSNCTLNMAQNQQGLWHFVPDHFWSRSFFWSRWWWQFSPKCCWQGRFKCHTIWNTSKACAKHIVGICKILTNLQFSHKFKIKQCPIARWQQNYWHSKVRLYGCGFWQCLWNCTVWKGKYDTHTSICILSGLSLWSEATFTLCCYRLSSFWVVTNLKGQVVQKKLTWLHAQTWIFSKFST